MALCTITTVVKLGDQIRILRKARGWSAQRLSDEIGGLITRQMIADLEVGRRKDLPMSAGAAIANAFEITLDQLMDEKLTAHIRRSDIEARLVDLRSEMKQLEEELKTLTEED